LCADQRAVYQAYLRRSGDTLLLIPVGVLNIGQLTAQGAAARREGARRQNLTEALHAAEEWMASGPTESRPKIEYGRILLRLGEVARADSVLRSVKSGVHLSRPQAG